MTCCSSEQRRARFIVKVLQWGNSRHTLVATHDRARPSTGNFPPERSHCTPSTLQHKRGNLSRCVIRLASVSSSTRGTLLKRTMFTCLPTLRPQRTLAVGPVAATTPRHKGALEARKNRPKKVRISFACIFSVHRVRKKSRRRCDICWTCTERTSLRASPPNVTRYFVLAAHGMNLPVHTLWNLIASAAMPLSFLPRHICFSQQHVLQQIMWSYMVCLTACMDVCRKPHPTRSM